MRCGARRRARRVPPAQRGAAERDARGGGRAQAQAGPAGGGAAAAVRLWQVRNLGKPVELAGRYFAEGADEITFLNITGHGSSLHPLPSPALSPIFGALPAAYGSHHSVARAATAPSPLRPPKRAAAAGCSGRSEGCSAQLGAEV